MGGEQFFEFSPQICDANEHKQQLRSLLMTIGPRFIVILEDQSFKLVLYSFRQVQFPARLQVPLRHAQLCSTPKAILSHGSVYHPCCSAEPHSSSQRWLPFSSSKHPHHHQPFTHTATPRLQGCSPIQICDLRLHLFNHSLLISYLSILLNNL